MTIEEDELRMLETVAPGAADPAPVDDRMLETVAPGPADPAPVDDRMLEPVAPVMPAADAQQTGAAAEVVRVVTRTENQPGSASPSQQVSDGAPHAGMTVNKYQLIRELGRGGMGSVFLARDTRLGRLVAVKFLNVHNQRLNARFIAEAQTTAQCSHENIVVLYEADEYQGQPYMVLEYLEGKPLDRLIDASRAARGDSGQDGLLMPVARVVELMVPVVRALERAHDMGIVHRDLKPANVMLTDSGTVKVLDFGIAKVLAADTEAETGAEAGEPDGRPPSQVLADIHVESMQATRGIIGTLPYMSPEQIQSGAIDGRTDIWALGIMLYEMVTGEHPLAPVTLKKLDQVARLDIPMPRVIEMRPDLGKLGAIIDRCLIKRVHDRMGSARELLDELQPLLPTHGGAAALGADESPFTGLAAFQEADADRFFGRASDIANLVTKVRNQPLIAVIGPSGVGKSSLVRAGVIPALKRSGEGWESLVVRPGRTPLAGLADLLRQLSERYSTTSSSTRATTRRGNTESEASSAGDEREETEWRHLETRLKREPGLLGTELRTWAQRKLRRLVIFVDQFEEIYTANPDPEERAAFLACLSGIADDSSSPLRVVFSMRSDFLERMADDREFMADATRGLVFLAPMGRAGLREALEKPLEGAGYRFENQTVVESMLDELEHTPGALPLLQFTASHLWDDRDRGRKLLTEASYQSMGGIAGTLARHADQVLAGMPGSHVRLARAVFQRLVTPERTRAIASMSELLSLPGDSEDIEDVLRTLANARLLVVESGGAGTGQSGATALGEIDSSTVEIVHESLIDRWPTLRRWLDENQDDAAFLARLRTAAKEWHRSDKATGVLWRGEVAREAEIWHERYQGELPAHEREFLQAVFAAGKHSSRRRRRIIYGVIAALVLIALVGAVAATKAQQVNTINAQMRELAERKQELKDTLAIVDEARREAERQREAADKARIAAETERSAADQARHDAEVAQAAAETAQAEAETQRQLVEQALTETEHQRQLAEARRQEAETAKQQAEQARQRAEDAKKEAQEAYKLAESRKRELDKLVKKYGIKQLDLK